MRLTLRTLLAYLDDVLEPAEAKEIGKKLQDSPMATALVSRIREVMRRPRFGGSVVRGIAARLSQTKTVVGQTRFNRRRPAVVGHRLAGCDLFRCHAAGKLDEALVAAAHENGNGGLELRGAGAAGSGKS